MKGYSQPQRTFICEMKHKYAVGEKVRVTKHHEFVAGAEGEIVGIMLYTFIAPAYYVQIGGSIVAVSERSLEKR